jgi:hypothetical protein
VVAEFLRHPAGAATDAELPYGAVDRPAYHFGG